MVGEEDQRPAAETAGSGTKSGTTEQGRAASRPVRYWLRRPMGFGATGGRGTDTMTGSWSKWLRIPSLADRLRAQGVREDVIAAATRTAFGRQTDRALPALNEVLTKSEGVIQLVEGRHHGTYGLLVLTSRRLVFLPAESARDGQTVAVDLSDVLTVDWQIHRGLGVVEVTTGSGPFMVDKILGNQAESITTGTRQAMSPPPDGPAAHRDPLEQLAELRAMHDAGLIGDAEFQARKQDLFGQI